MFPNDSAAIHLIGAGSRTNTTLDLTRRYLSEHSRSRATRAALVTLSPANSNPSHERHHRTRHIEHTTTLRHNSLAHWPVILSKAPASASGVRAEARH
jgi:hypothetical protein